MRRGPWKLECKPGYRDLQSAEFCIECRADHIIQTVNIITSLCQQLSNPVSSDVLVHRLLEDNLNQPSKLFILSPSQKEATLSSTPCVIVSMTETGFRHDNSATTPSIKRVSNL